MFRPPQTLVHGDTHLENIFFGEQFEGGTMFIDFGLTALGHPLSDISELLGTGMRPKVSFLLFGLVVRCRGGQVALLPDILLLVRCHRAVPIATPSMFAAPK